MLVAIGPPRCGDGIANNDEPCDVEPADVFSACAADCTVAVSEQEPNDVLADANPSSDAFTGSISERGDVDVIDLGSLPAGTLLTAEIADAGVDDCDTMDPEITVVHADGRVVDSDDDGGWGSAPGSGTCSSPRTTATSSSSTASRMTASSSSTGSSSITTSWAAATTSWRARRRATAIPHATAVSPWTCSCSTRSSQRGRHALTGRHRQRGQRFRREQRGHGARERRRPPVIDRDAIVHGAGTVVGDEDVFGVRNGTDGDVDVVVEVSDGAFGICSIDPELALRSFDGELLATDDDSGAGECPRMAFSLSPGEARFLQITDDHDDEQIGTWALHVDFR